MRSPSPDEAASFERFAREYRLAQHPLMLSIERAVCGCAYGGTSWTTRDEAERVARLLELAPGTRLLDLGAGSGWPGLYLARITGCDVTLVDFPPDALRIAALRAAADQLASRVRAAVADGTGLPFPGGQFDAISHSDVLCCLEPKLAVLEECRRVIRAGGRMVFSVISIAPSLSDADHRRAASAGPWFKVTSTEYPDMLARTGWHLLRYRDVTPAYGAAVAGRLAEEEANAATLAELFGAAEFAELMERRRETASAIRDGLLRREIYAARAIGP